MYRTASDKERQFQSTFPRGERHNNSSCLKPFHNFNPRSHVGNDLFYSFLLSSDGISIHVPTWGTTDTPPILKANGEFQSTFPRGERQGMTEEEAKAMVISIHVPTWGTTLLIPSSLLITAISIHVPTWGTTKIVFVILVKVSISIHVPTWGTTLRVLIAFSTEKISIHVPTWGTTNADAWRIRTLQISIHVPTWGTTIYPSWQSPSHKNFNPRSHVGNDLFRAQSAT